MTATIPSWNIPGQRPSDDVRLTTAERDARYNAQHLPALVGLPVLDDASNATAAELADHLEATAAALRARQQADHVAAYGQPDEATTQALVDRLTRSAAIEAGADPDTGERLEQSDRAVTGIGSYPEVRDPASEVCWLALRTRRSDGLEGVRWTRCGKRTCASCGPKRVEHYEGQLLNAVPDVDLVRVIEVAEATWQSSIRSKVSHAARDTDTGYWSCPIAQGRRLVLTDAPIAEGQIVDMGEALVMAGDRLDELRTDPEMKGRRVSVGGEWKNRRDEGQQRQERRSEERSANELPIEYLGLVTSAPNPEHVAKVAESLGAKAVPVARTNQDVRDDNDQLIVSDVLITGLAPLTAQVFWKRLGFVSWADLVERRRCSETEAELKNMVREMSDRPDFQRLAA